MFAGLFLQRSWENWEGARWHQKRQQFFFLLLVLNMELTYIWQALKYMEQIPGCRLLPASIQIW